MQFTFAWKRFENSERTSTLSGRAVLAKMNRAGLERGGVSLEPELVGSTMFAPVADASAFPSWSRGIAGTRVLLADEHYKHCLGIVRHLGKAGARISVVAASRDSLVCRSRFCNEVILSNSPALDDIVETLLRAAGEKQFDVVIPVSMAMTRALADRRAALVRFTNLIAADVDSIDCAADKFRMTSLAESLGIPVPTTLLLSDAVLHSERIHFPVVVKPRKEVPGRPPVRYAQNAAELRTILAQLSQAAFAVDNFLVQEFIPGTGYGFFATYQRGLCKRIFMHRRVREYPATGGVSSCAESIADPKLERYGRQMLEALKWHGVAMVEFRRDSRDGSYKLIEVNPKFWGSLDLALAAGADFPGDLCRMARGETLVFTDKYRRNLRFHWPFSGHGDLFHLWTRPVSSLRVISDFINPWVRSNLWLGDFSPNLREFRDLVSRFSRKSKG